MEVNIINDATTFEDFKDYIRENNYKNILPDSKILNQLEVINNVDSLEFAFEDHEKFIIQTRKFSPDYKRKIITWLNGYIPEDINKIIYGKDTTERIVSCEASGSSIELFLEGPEGVTTKVIPNRNWMLLNKSGYGTQELKGDLYYKYIKYYNTEEAFELDKRKVYKNDGWVAWDNKEAAMLLKGFTYFKGMKPEDVSLLSFDIETTTLEHNSNSKVLLISNTFRKNGNLERKLFAYNDYKSEAEFFDAWCNWVREKNPSILTGYNITIFDLPYIDYCANKAGTSLSLGRDNSDIKFADKESKVRVDGSQAYSYKRIKIYGREIVDMFFVALKYDSVSRKYSSYKMKNIISQEGLEDKDRQHYDAGTIKDNYLIPEEWEKIKRYAINDADDPIKLFNLMIPSFFYLTRSIPKSFQAITESASGSQINSLLCRSYLQDGYSIPKKSPRCEFTGAISDGYPGLYKNVYKVDVSSLYPSIMIEYSVYDKNKDPRANFSKMVNYLTNERLQNKKLAKETGDRYYKDLEQSQKIIINSAYGMMGADGLNFNSIANADFITRTGREILNKSIKWATGLNYEEYKVENSTRFKLVNLDTDSISFCKLDNSPFSKDELIYLLEELNSLYPKRIQFEDDGYFKSILVIKTKNYVIEDFNGKLTIKGSALKATTKEPALKQFIKEIINLLLQDKKDDVLELYKKYVIEVCNLTSIDNWVSRKTITEKVLNAERSNEQNVLDAINEDEDEQYQEGDKVYVYFTKDGSLKLKDFWNNDHDNQKLIEKIYKTLSVFSTVINMEQYPKYHLKTKINELHSLLGLPPVIKEKKVRKKKEITNEIHV